MTTLEILKSIDPFYGACLERAAATSNHVVGGDKMVSRPVYARLPQAPVNASPVPGLTSLYHNPERGPYGDRSYPGNCSGNLIRDLLRFFRPATVLDPMTGSGTCRDVCKELAIYCWSNDLREGFDACGGLPFSESFQFCWLHPPYWRQKLYCDDPRDLSRAPTLEAFLERYRLLIENCAAALLPGGRLVEILPNGIQERIPLKTGR